MSIESEVLKSKVIMYKRIVVKKGYHRVYEAVTVGPTGLFASDM